MTVIIEVFDEPEFAWMVSYAPGNYVRYVGRPFGDLDAEQYLAFAREDLESAKVRGTVNAATNAKRALHYAIERLAWHFGFNSEVLPRGFPDRARLLEQLGLLPAAVLVHYNQLRNVVEHEYSACSVDVSSQMIALSDLVIRASVGALRRTVADMQVELADRSRYVSTALAPGSGTLQVSGQPVTLAPSKRDSWWRYVRLHAWTSDPSTRPALDLFA